MSVPRPAPQRTRIALSSRVCAASALLLLLGACGGTGGGGGGDFVPLGVDAGLDSTRVALNQPIVFKFSADVFPSSVTPDTILIRKLPEFAVPARGTFEVSGRRVTFHPDLPADFDLPRGGLEIGARYRILVRGAGAGANVLSVGRKPLGAGIDTGFTVASDTDPPLYVDVVPGPPEVAATSPVAALPLGDTSVSVDSAVSVSFGEPLLPATVTRETVSIFDVSGPRPRRLAGDLRLDQTVSGATVRFDAVPSLPENAVVEIRVEGALLDLGRHAVVPFAGRFATGDSPARDGQIVEEFDDARFRDGEASTADWSGGGRLAPGRPPGGDGSDGPFEPLEDTVVDTTERAERQFSRIVVPEGVTVTVTGPRGAVWRAFGDAEIAGAIVLDGGPGGEGDNDAPGGFGGLGGPGGGPGGSGGCPESARTVTEGGPGAGRVPGEIAPLDGGGLGGSNSTSSLGAGGGGGGGYFSAGAPGGGASGAGGFPSGREEGVEADGSITGGAGGGGGGCDDDFSGARNDGGGGGGGGGGALLLVSSGTVRLCGRIEARGGPGGNSRGQGGGGGGGSGGLAVVRGETVEALPGALVSVRGGAGGAAPADGRGGDGGHGRVRFEDADGAIDDTAVAIDPDLPGIATTGVAPPGGPGETVAVSLFRDTGVEDPRYAFDGADPSTGLVIEGASDVLLSDPVPPGAAIRIEFEGAEGDALDSAIPDPRTRTGFSTDVRAIEGRRFVRFRVRFTAPEARPDARPPAIERLRIRFAYH